MHDLVRSLALMALVACALAAVGARAQGSGYASCPNTCTSDQPVVMNDLRCSGAPVDGSVCARLAALEAAPPPTSSSGAVVPAPPPPSVDALACATGDAICARLAAVEAALVAAQTAVAAAQATTAALAARTLADYVNTDTIILAKGACPSGFTPSSAYNERFLAFSSTHSVPTAAVLAPGSLASRTAPMPNLNAPAPAAYGGGTKPAVVSVAYGTPVSQIDLTPLVYMVACVKAH